MTIRLQGEANTPPPEYYKGFQDCLEHLKHWYSRRRTLKGTGWYCNGWAEGNITSSTIWRNYWENTLINRDN